MTESIDQARRVARQHLETSRLMGVDFVPRSGTEEEGAAPGETDSSMLIDDKARRLEELRQRHDATCPHCTTATGHNRIVFGEGHPDADLMFIGEAPGAEEDRTGRPFVGRAGQKLDDILRAMGLHREEVYIGNVLKSRPPNNRTPQRHEVEGCSPFLVEQIRIIQPRVIVTLGGPATKLILDTDLGITRLRGQWAEYVDLGADPPLSIPVMPTFHPAYLLRNYTRDTREKMWSDMQEVSKKLNSP